VPRPQKKTSQRDSVKNQLQKNLDRTSFSYLYSFFGLEKKVMGKQNKVDDFGFYTLYLYLQIK